VRDELRKKLRSWLMTFPIPADNNAERMVLDEEARKQLRNLGYLQ